MPISKTFVRQKLKYIIADIERIRQILRKKTYEALVTDEASSALCERYLERVITRAIDINCHLLRAAGESPPDDYTQSFLDLVKIKALSPKLASDIAPAAGARNILVHEYDELDSELFYSSLQDAVKLFPKYVRAIEKYVDS